MRKALAYLRTSSAANVGADKDSDKRQMAAIEAYASRNGIEIVLQPYNDAAVSGADPIEARSNFRAMLDYLAEHKDVRAILVETASRFARDLIVQETGYRMLKARGIDLIAVDSPESFVADTPTAELIRQLLGAVSQFEKAMLVSKLRVARERKRAANGKCEGRKSHAERQGKVVALVHKLRRQNSRTGLKRSYREISRLLAERGHKNVNDQPYAAVSIMAMLEQRVPRSGQQTA